MLHVELAVIDFIPKLFAADASAAMHGVSIDRSMR